MNQTILRTIRARNGLIYFNQFKELNQWLKDNKDDIKATGGLYNKMRHVITFPNGNCLYLGYGDPNKFLGCEFMFVEGCPELQNWVRI